MFVCVAPARMHMSLKGKHNWATYKRCFWYTSSQNEEYGSRQVGLFTASVQTHSAFADVASASGIDVMEIYCQFPVRSLLVLRKIGVCVSINLINYLSDAVVTNASMVIYSGGAPVQAQSIIKRMEYNKRPIGFWF